MILTAIVVKNATTVYDISVQIMAKNGSADSNGSYLKVYPVEVVIPSSDSILNLPLVIATNVSSQNLKRLTLELLLTSGQQYVELGSQTTAEISFNSEIIGEDLLK